MANIIQTFPAGAGGGHTILDSTGTALAQEKNLKITGLSVTDSPSDESTDLAPAGLNQDSIDDIAAVGLPSSNIVGSGLNYSTTEQIVGRWIDGKPVYQKTIDFGYLPNNTVKTVAHNINNLDWVVDAKGIAYNGSGGYRSIPILYNTTYASYNTAFLVRLADIQLEVNNDMSAFYAYITIQYTKTTD